MSPQLRATGMAVYFLFMYVLGGGIGTLITGMLSDSLATQAMVSAGATEMSDLFRAIGLRSSLLWVIPIAMVVTSIAIALGSLTYLRDVKRAQQAGAQQ